MGSILKFVRVNLKYRYSILDTPFAYIIKCKIQFNHLITFIIFAL